ncbi:MAG TPA: hypothetical protein VLE95_01750 [Chlamydiales bacterium]|nr:hypothetical protein [Chlamydiales bacterium]
MRRSWFIQWWWVILFSFVVISIYFHNIQNKKSSLRALSFRLDKMHLEKAIVMQERETFLRQIASQSDPSWIEMILMRDLGMVPEGWIKVHFTK